MVNSITRKSRAGYAKNYRKVNQLKNIAFLVDKSKIDELDSKLELQGKTRKQWFLEKVDEEIYDNGN